MTGPGGPSGLYQYGPTPPPRFPDPPRRARASRHRQPLPKPGLRLVALVLTGFLLSGLGGAAAYFAPVLAAAVSVTGGPAIKQVKSPAAAATPTAAAAPASNVQAFTVLLLGSDNDQKFPADQLLTQSMILVRVDPASKSVTMLSIARDLYVPIAGFGMEKIDAAYADGGANGAQTAVQTVEQDFGVRVDNYVWIGLKGLIQLIDSVGGVDVVTSNPVMDDFYPNDINSPDPNGFQRVAVLPGAQHLDGTHALQYVRARHSDLNGDFGRSARQQQVLLALRAKAKNINPADLPTLAGALNGELKTDMSLQQVRALLPIAAKIDPQQVRQITLLNYTQAATLDDGEEVEIPNWDMILPLVHQYFP
ncbi:MAG: LCP family protein [Candidatus Dormibacteraeota bacterium]|nr:LCP family protein [Candidatus Dormibacteraeota bacterium]